MKILFPASALLAVALIAGCKKENHTIVAGQRGDEAAATAPKLDPASLPPAIVATKTYRCKDNSLVYIDWLANDAGANFRAAQTDAATQLKPGADGKAPYTAEGYSLAGGPAISSITLTRPGKGKQTCHA